MQLGEHYRCFYCSFEAASMNTQQVLLYHVQFTLPNATTRATAALQNWACWLASVLQPLAADWKPRPGAYSLKLTDGRPTGFRSTPSPRRPLVLAPRQKHRERKESYTHILTRKDYMSQCSCHSWNTSMLLVSSGSAHVTSAWLPILRLIL